MIDLCKIEGIYLYGGKIDMRKSINGLSVLVSEHFSREEMKNKLFLFYGKKKNNLKVLEYEYNGFWLYQKKLFNGKFLFPKHDKLLMIDKRQLSWLLDGLSIIQRHAHKDLQIDAFY